uniref:Pkinase_Tyr domain-containing protein n=1 Tax=Heterorhabditis bacteriophora TaxID=37862 RepID=A0A1I7W7L2_HETBA
MTRDECEKLLKKNGEFLGERHQILRCLYRQRTHNDSDGIGNLFSSIEIAGHRKSGEMLGNIVSKKYLKSARIKHFLVILFNYYRDIAARNCLLGAKNEVKISDFGLSILGNEIREKKMKNVPLRGLVELARSVLCALLVVFCESRGYLHHHKHVLLIAPILGVYFSIKMSSVKSISSHFLKVSLMCLGEIPADIEALRLRCMDYDPNKRPNFEQMEALVLQTFLDM